MTGPKLRRRASLIVLISALVLTSACSKPPPYVFVTANTEVETGHDVVVEVRLWNTAADAYVNDAMITAVSLTMAPDGMNDITSDVTPQPSTEVGAFRFSATFRAAGRWELALAARIPGERNTVMGSVVIRAK